MGVSPVRKRMIPKEFLGAFKAGHRPSVRAFIDEELSWRLLDQLEKGCEQAKEALQYLTRFNNEFHKNVIRKGDDLALHCTDELRRDCYARENARNRDVYTKHKDIGVDLRDGVRESIQLRIGKVEDDVFRKNHENHRRTDEYDW